MSESAWNATTVPTRGPGDALGAWARIRSPGLSRGACCDAILATGRTAKAMRTSVSRRMGAPLGWRSNTASLPSLHHAHRGQSVGRGPVAELAVEVVAPAIGGTRAASFFALVRRQRCTGRCLATGIECGAGG